MEVSLFPGVCHWEGYIGYEQICRMLHTLIFRLGAGNPDGTVWGGGGILAGIVTSEKLAGTRAQLLQALNKSVSKV